MRLRGVSLEGAMKLWFATYTIPALAKEVKT